jgi:hypothetical protein
MLVRLAPVCLCSVDRKQETVLVSSQHDGSLREHIV